MGYANRVYIEESQTERWCHEARQDLPAKGIIDNGV